MSLYSTVVSWLSAIPRSLAKLDRGSGDRWELGDGPTFAGKAVNPSTTMQLAAAWSCIRLNARTIGSLPLQLFERGVGNDRRLADNHPLYNVLAVSPNSDQTAMEYWEGQITALNLRGNAYSRIARRGDGQVIALWPVYPDFAQVYRTQSGERRYKLWNGRETEDLPASEVFHLRGFGAGGDMGLSPIAYGRQTISTALAAEETAGSTFSNGLQTAGFVEMASNTKLTHEQRQQLIELFDKFSGSGQTGKVMPLDAGMKFTPLKLTAEDAQLLETRRFEVEELCRWFGIFPVMIGHNAAGQTMWGSGVEQIMLAWLAMYLGPELTRIEQAILKQLVLPKERARLCVDYDTDRLLRADSAGRAALYASLGQNGIRTRNEMRQEENLAPLPGGDVLTVQSNLIPLDRIGRDNAAPADQARSALMNLMFGGDVDALIDARVKAALAAGRPLH